MTCPHGFAKPICLECLPARIRAKIEVQPDGCWYWVAAIGDHGYGMAWDPNRGSMVGAHRDKATCKHGHALTPENVYRDPNTGWRYCRACRTRRNRETYERIRERQRA